jgi:hypothetical protein
MAAPPRTAPTALRTILCRSESLDDDPLVEVAVVPDARRDAAVPRDDPPRVLLAPEDRLDPDDLLVPEYRLVPEDRLEPDDLLVPEDRLEPEGRLERADLFAVEPAPRLADVPLEAAAALVCPLLERLLRGDALDLLALPRDVVAALREPLPPLLALLPAVFRPVCF